MKECNLSDDKIMKECNLSDDKIMKDAIQNVIQKMNQYTIECFWSVPSGTGSSYLFAEARDLVAAKACLAANFKQQGYTIESWGTITKHTSTRLDAAPTTNGRL